MAKKDIPTSCPCCGQPLVDEAAVRRVREHEAELRKQLESEATAAAEQRLAGERAKLQQEIRKENAQREQALDRTMKALQQRNEELERRLQKMTARERGDSQEIDVFGRLQQAFANDKIERQGRSGDIIHTVRHDFGGGLQEAGTIVYECKDTLRWKTDFVAQTKKAGRAHGSLYRVLVTWAFPAGETDLCVRDGVILVHPAKVVLLAEVVRRMVIEVRRAGLTAEGQADKASSLYAYLSGDEFRSTFDGIVGAAEELDKLLRDEKQAHERTWGRRAQVHETLARKTAAIDGCIRGILEAPTAAGAKVIAFPARTGRRMRA